MTEIRQLTDEERNSLRFLHQERGGMERHVRWEEFQPILERWHPELLKAHRDLIVAQRILDILVESLL